MEQKEQCNCWPQFLFEFGLAGKKKQMFSSMKFVALRGKRYNTITITVTFWVTQCSLNQCGHNQEPKKYQTKNNQHKTHMYM